MVAKQLLLVSRLLSQPIFIEAKGEKCFFVYFGLMVYLFAFVQLNSPLGCSCCFLNNNISIYCFIYRYITRLRYRKTRSSQHDERINEQRRRPILYTMHLDPFSLSRQMN